MDGRPEPDRSPGLVISMIDTDPSRWRRSLRPSSTCAALALLAVLIAAVLSGCGSSGSAQSSTAHGRTHDGRPAETTSTATTPADVASPNHRSIGRPRPHARRQANRRRARQAPGRRALGAGRWRARARHDRDAHRVRVGDRGPGRQTQRRVARGDQRACRERASGLDPRVGDFADRRRLANLRQHRPPADHRPVRQSGRQADPDLDRRRRRDHPDRPLRGHRSAAHRRRRRAHTAVASSRCQRFSRCTCPTGTAAIGSRSTPPTTPRRSASPPATAARTWTTPNGKWLLAHIPDGTPVVIADAPFHRGRGSPA